MIRLSRDIISSLVAYAKKLAPIIYVILGAILGPYFGHFIPNWIDYTEISYSQDNAIKILDKNTVSNMDLRINDARVTELFGQVVHIWNSGTKSIENLRITYYFDGVDDDFKIFDILNNVSPLLDISYNKTEGSSDFQRYSYKTIIPNNEFTVLILTNEKVPVKISMKAEGLSKSDIKKINPVLDKASIRSLILPGFAGFIITLIIIFLLNRGEWITISALKSHNVYTDLRTRWTNYSRQMEIRRKLK